MKRLEIHFYNFPSTSHLKVRFYAFKKTAKYFGNKSEFFVLEEMSQCLGDNTIQHSTIQFNKMESKAMQCNAIQHKAIQ